MFAIYNGGQLIQTNQLTSADYKACRNGEVSLVDINDAKEYINGDWHPLEHIDVSTCAFA